MIKPDQIGLNFIKLDQTSSNWNNWNLIKLDQTWSNWIKLDQIGIIWIKLDQICLYWIKQDQTYQIGINWINLDQIGIKLIKSDQWVIPVERALLWCTHLKFATLDQVKSQDTTKCWTAFFLGSFVFVHKFFCNVYAGAAENPCTQIFWKFIYMIWIVRFFL